MSIKAALNGSLARVLLAAGGDARKCGIRAIDGRPPAGFGGDFFYGVYFAGFETDSSRMLESSERTYKIGVDITHRMARVPAGKQGPWVLDEGELLDRADKLPGYFLNGVAAMVAANAARPTPLKGVFFESFSYVTMSKVEMQSPDWIGAEASENAPTILAVKLLFGGLKWGQLLEELPT